MISQRTYERSLMLDIISSRQADREKHSESAVRRVLTRVSTACEMAS